MKFNSLGEKFWELQDFSGPGVILRWKPTGELPTREEITELYRSGYVYQSVFDDTIAEIDRVNDMYDSR